MEHTKCSKSGKVLTPKWVAEKMLQEMKYAECNDILGKHLMDNSCGDGALLSVAVHMYCEEYIRRNKAMDGLSDALSGHIHGIEIDADAVSECKAALDAEAMKYGASGVNWDIRCADALTVTEYDGKMDFVIGNPPYIRVRNLAGMYAGVRSFKFCQSGMTDIYIAFFELGIRMLSDSGVLCYVTPSAWLHSASGASLRRYIHESGILRSVMDFGHCQIFPGVTTYSMITVLDKRHHSENVIASTYSAGTAHRNTECCEGIFCTESVSQDDIWIDGKIYIGSADTLRSLRKILCCNRRCSAVVKNGFATLADSVFITDEHLPSCGIDVVKASTGKWRRAFYPYDENGRRRNPEDLFRVPEVMKYLMDHRNELLKSRDPSCIDWMYYGRTQALNDVGKWKFAVGNLVSKDGGIKITRVPPGSGVYGGLYITDPSGKVNVEDILRSPGFASYVRALGNYKSGGYYWVSSKDIKRFLDAIAGDPIS